MLSLSSLIDFLLSLLRDDDARAEFERDPHGTLARHGLDGVSAQDIRDVTPMLADCGGVTHQGGYRPGGDDHDPVRVIQHVTKTHQVQRETYDKQVEYKQVEYKQYHHEYHYTDNSVHVEQGGTYIKDSFNQDNDGVDNKGGVIDESNVVNGDENTVGNATDTTVIVDSFDEHHSESVVIVDSGNHAGDNSISGPDISGPDISIADISIADINSSYDVHAPSTAEPEPEPAADPAA